MRAACSTTLPSPRCQQLSLGANAPTLTRTRSAPHCQRLAVFSTSLASRSGEQAEEKRFRRGTRWRPLPPSASRCQQLSMAVTPGPAAPVVSTLQRARELLLHSKEQLPESLLYKLLQVPVEDLCALAAEVRDSRRDAHILTFSPKVFIPLTHLCRNTCGYCTFARAPRKGTLVLNLIAV